MAVEHTLGRRRILEAALELADGEGLEAVTMRRIAQCLEVGTMSLYHYVPNKADLLAGMVDMVFEQVERPPDGMTSWVDRVVYVSLSFRRAALAHPAVVSLVASGSTSGPVVLQSTEAYLGAIAQRGFDPQTAAHVYRSAASYIIGYLSLELGGYFGSVVASLQHGGLEEAESGEYPCLSEVGPHLSVWNPEREFEAGLRRLLAGFHEDLASALRQPKPQSASERDGASANPP